jgi:predicted Zn-dependent protease
VTTSRFSNLFKRHGAARSLAALLVLGLLAPQAWAWYQLRAARAAMEKYHPEEARADLAKCSRVWNERASVHLLAARAARQDEDLEAAVAELRAAQRLAGGATDDTALEWALIQAASGNVREVEEYLQKRAEQSPSVAGPLVWEALAVGYLRVSRTLDAMACLNFWLKREKDNVRALELRGRTYVAGKGVVRGAEDYRRVLELDPSRKQTLWLLIGALLVLGGYDEAAGLLEQFAKEKPGDPEVAARLARCYAMLGRGQDADRLIDAALETHPNDGPCLRTRGQLFLIERRPAEGEAALRRAVAQMPADYQAQQLLFQSLQQQGKVEEAKAQLKVAEQVRNQAEHLGELSSRKLAEFPLDPALHYEMGKLLIETGRGEIGERWLITALELDSDYRPAHAELAAYYERIGDKVRAEEHRRKASQ